MIGVIDVGGGMRGIYGAGVFDYCMDRDIHFDACFGVSAGAANISSYVAHQRGRNHRYYAEYAFRKEYMGWENMLRTRSYINLDYIYGTLSNSTGEYPLDFPAMVSSGISMEIVTTDARTGRPCYFGLNNMQQDHYDPIKASSCVPVVNQPYFIDGVPYYDGGISDPVPVNRAFRSGCDKVVLILTRPRDDYRSSTNDRRLASLLRRRYPKAAQKLSQRAQIYNHQLNLAKSYEKRGKLLIVAPKSISGMRTLTKDRSAMEFMYKEGYEDAGKILEFIS